MDDMNISKLPKMPVVLDVDVPFFAHHPTEHGRMREWCGYVRNIYYCKFGCEWRLVFYAHVINPRQGSITKYFTPWQIELFIDLRSRHIIGDVNRWLLRLSH